MKEVLSSTIAQLEKIQKQFIWRNENSKLKHTTIYNEYEQGGLKNVDIFSKIKSLQCSWVERLYDDSFHARKVIPLFLIKNHLGKIFLFHSNLRIKQKIVKKLSTFYQEILTRCKMNNEYIKIDNNTIYYLIFLKNALIILVIFLKVIIK